MMMNKDSATLYSKFRLIRAIYGDDSKEANEAEKAYIEAKTKEERNDESKNN